MGKIGGEKFTRNIKIFTCPAVNTSGRVLFLSPGHLVVYIIVRLDLTVDLILSVSGMHTMGLLALS